MGTAQLVYGLDSDQVYEPCPIVQRDSLPQKPARIAEAAGRTPDPGLDAFAEIAVAGSEGHPADEREFEHVYGRPAPQPIDADDDKTRTIFRELRSIAQEGVWYRMDKTEVFYRQARLMENFTDDYEGSAPLSCYYPRYQKLDYSQLRTYFTWRTAAREGTIAETSASYAFLHLYELINGVGANNPRDGLERLTATWRALRADLPVLDRYVPDWIKDYCVVYPLDISFREFALLNNLQEHYPAVFCYDAEGREAFELYARIASYDIAKSVFFTEDRKDMIAECFAFVLAKLRTRFSEKKRRFEDGVFTAQRRGSRWTPFNKALFYSTLAQPRREVHISEKEVYTCEAGRWTARRVVLADQGAQLAGYLLKATESQLRKHTGFKHRLTANLDTFKAIDQRSFEKLGLSIPRIVEEACAEFYERYTFRNVSVDLDRLKRIRTDALSTQEKLIVADTVDARNAAPTEAACIDAARCASAPSAPDPLKSAHRLAAHPTFQTRTSPATTDPPPESASAPDQQTVWQKLVSSLSETHREALAALCAGNDLKQFANDRAIMLEVLLDGINEKSMDCIGDAIVESEGGIALVEDYEDDLRKAMDA